MSFLAQLRQQKPESKGLKLCYLLDVDHEHHTAMLSLILVEFQQGQYLNIINSANVIKGADNVKDFGRPYHLQRQHLQYPPPFIFNEDIGFLQSLIDDDALWLESHQCQLTQRNGPSLLRYVLNSQRCFVKSNDSAKLVHPGEGRQVSLVWHVDQFGNQSLGWQIHSFEQVFFLDRPFVFDTNSGAIHEGICDFNLKALAAVIAQNKPLPPSKVVDFMSEHQQQWQSWGLALPKLLAVEKIESWLVPVLRLASAKGRHAKQNTLQLEFRYCNDDYCVTMAAACKHDEISYWDGNTLKCLQRQHHQEQALAQQLLPFLDNFNQGIQDLSWHSNDSDVWRILLTQAREPLQTLGFTFVFEKGFRHHYLLPEHWQVGLQACEGESWQLVIQLQVDKQSIDLLGLLQRLQSLAITSDGNQYCLALNDGRLLLLPKDKINSLAAELGDLTGSRAGPYQLPSNQLNRLAPLQDFLPENTEWLGDLALLERSNNIHRQPEQLQNLVDKKFYTLNAQLRPYQQLGVFWLQHLKQHHVNGLLADDMGLGKTMQTLAHLYIEQQLGELQQPALIVVPTSLLHNWSAEIKRFAPRLQFIVLHGSERHQYWDQLVKYDVIITSYSLIGRDLTQWQRQQLSWVILDEAQIIKNPRTQISQAVRHLNSRHRLCLSGTPVENHLGELWSIFDFLMPNCLGSETEFTHYFKIPIERHADSQRFQQLLKRIAPFMLRRTKEQVAKDLPPKTQILKNIVLGDDQRSFYDQLKEKTWLQLQESFAQGAPGNSGNPGFNTGQQQIQVLTALLKLRQACCDPQLLGEEHISSAKKAHCLEMISELVAENRTVILFSQFTSMLNLLAKELDESGVDYLMLTGTSRNRQQLVEDFQAGKAPLFLISLKAGGVGLNLTRADTVIHYDPWWNSAAEQQASDRAHRIGQDKPVFVYKLIVEDSIEERIAQLQQRKAILSQNISDQAQLSGEQFAFKLEDLLSLWGEEELAATC